MQQPFGCAFLHRTHNCECVAGGRVQQPLKGHAPCLGGPGGACPSQQPPPPLSCAMGTGYNSTGVCPTCPSWLSTHPDAEGVAWSTVSGTVGEWKAFCSVSQDRAAHTLPPAPHYLLII